MPIPSTPGANHDPEQRDLDPSEVCTLPPDGLAERMAWIHEEILPHAIETVRLEGGLSLELASAPGLAASLDRLIELERACCTGIVFERLESTTPSRLRLEIRGIDPDAALFRSLRTPVQEAGPQLAKAAGIGVLASLFVCCLLPIGAGALLGAAAAPLAALDGPGPIAAGALVGSTAAWWWLGRRRTREAGGEDPPSTACGPGC